MMGGMLLAVPSLVSAQSSYKLNDKVLTLKSYTQDPKKTNSQSDVIIIRDVDKNNQISAKDHILIAEKNQKGEITYKTMAFTVNAVGDSVVMLPNNEDVAKWTLTETPVVEGGIPGTTNVEGWLYSLKNKKADAYLTVNYKTGLEIVKTYEGSLSDAKLDEENTLTSLFKTKYDSYVNRIGAGNISALFVYAPNVNGENDLMPKSDGFSIGNSETNPKYTGTYNLLIATAEPRTVGIDEGDYVDELNDVKGGKGFEFEVQTKNDLLENIFDGLELRAFRVDADFDVEKGKDKGEGTDNDADSIVWEAGGNYYEIPKGVYLATEWSQLDENTLKYNTITTKEEFQKATFIAVSPTDFIDLTNTVQDNGKGFALTTVKGSDMNFYAAETAKNEDAYNANLESKNDEVYVGNACFTIKVDNPLAANDEYKLSLAAARWQKEDGSQTGGSTLYISEIANTNNDNEDTVQGYTYLLTNNKAEGVATVKAVPSSTIADATDLLNEEATPAIYAVKFLSGKDDEVSEYGQYLTFVNNSNRWKAAIMPSVNDGANENDPLYQFVVTGVENNDGDDEGNYETIVLTNRLTKQPVKVVLYTEDKENNIYTIYPAADEDGNVNRAEEWLVAYTDNTDEDKLKLDGKSIRGMQVQLIEQENIAKFATF